MSTNINTVTEKSQQELVNWTPADMLEVQLETPDDFLKVAETLTRIGVKSKLEKKLTQSVHILHKRGRYFLMHFKELFMLDGKYANFSYQDLYRRNRIAKMLEEWGLIKILNPNAMVMGHLPAFNQIKIIPYSAKDQYELVSKYAIGCKKRVD